MRANLLCSTDGMSISRGPTFDPLLDYCYQNSAMGVCKHEEQSFSYVPELTVEVSEFNLAFCSRI